MRVLMDKMQDVAMTKTPCPNPLDRVRDWSRYCVIMIDRVFDGHGFHPSRLMVRTGLMFADRSHNFLYD
jgi:hypothetical protein